MGTGLFCFLFEVAGTITFGKIVVSCRKVVNFMTFNEDVARLGAFSRSIDEIAADLSSLIEEAV